MQEQERGWAELIELCWQTDPDRRPSFRNLSQRPEFREDDGSGSNNNAGRSAAVTEPKLPPRSLAAPAPSEAASWGPYTSETEVSTWLQASGLGKRVAVAAASDEDFCDFAAFEAMALGDRAAQVTFVECMALSDQEKRLFTEALERLKLQLLRDPGANSDGRGSGGAPTALAANTATIGRSRGGSSHAALGVSRPASPSAMPVFGGAE